MPIFAFGLFARGREDDGLHGVDEMALIVSDIARAGPPKNRSRAWSARADGCTHFGSDARSFAITEVVRAYLLFG